MRYTKKIGNKQYVLKNNKSAQEKNIIKLGQLEDILDKYELKDAKALDNFIQSFISTLGAYMDDIEKYKKALVKNSNNKNKSKGISVFDILKDLE